MQKILTLLVSITILFAITACEKEDDGILGGGQSAIGEEGNSFIVHNTPLGVSNPSVSIIDLEDGVSTIKVSANITNSTLLDMLQSIDGYTDQAEKTGKFRVTTEGIESIYDDGSTFTLVRYDAKVGDVYTFTRGTMNLKREVTHVSTTDDFNWYGGQFLYLKTVDVKETGRNIPGLSSTIMHFNHKFGLVGYTLKLEDGSDYDLSVVSLNNNISQ